LAIGVLVAIAVALAAFVTLQQGQKSGAAAVEASLTSADAAQARLERVAFERIDTIARVIANDADFVRYIATATDDGLGLGDTTASQPVLDPAAPVDPAAVTDPAATPPPPAPEPEPEPAPEADTGSVKDLLLDQKTTWEFEFGMVLDSAGTLVARTDEREAYQEDFSEDPLIGPAVAGPENGIGYWRAGVILYQASVRPLALQDELVGFLIVGQPVDQAIAKQVREVSGGEVAYWLLDSDGLRLVATSIPEADQPALREALKTKEAEVKAQLAKGEGVDRIDLSLGGIHYAGKLTPLRGQGGEAVGGSLILTSVDSAMAPFTSIQSAVLLGGGVALLLALAVSWWLARRVLRPVAELAEAAEQASGGNYQQLVRFEGSDEVARLGRAFDSLLSDLREKKDIEGYVGHLSRFLPDPGSESTSVAPRVTAKPAARRTVVLVGLELRRFLRAPTVGEEAITLTALGQLIEEAQARAYSAGGELLEQEGPRLLFSFSGDAAELRALAAISAWMEGRVGAPDNGAAIAIADGEIVHGSLPAKPESTVTIGLPVLQVERLLGETPVGNVLMSPVFGEKLKRIGQTDVLKVATGQTSGKRFLSIDRAGLSTAARSAPGVAYATVIAGATDANATHIAGSTPAPTATDNASTRLQMGMRFASRYEILSILGSGGMGMVYKARDTDLSDVVALKMLRPGMMVDAEQIDQLKIELKLARKITHPNVLRTYDFGDFQGVPYISMEYVRGLTLRYLLQQAGKLPFSAALRIARQLCMGLDAAHAMGVIHRDIKPENIIIEQSGNAKLMDFGIAQPARRIGTNLEQPGTFVGTPNYASPEQLSGIDLDQRSDIYSTGVLLCEMFCGKLPFSGGNTMELYVAHLQQPPLKPSVLWPDIPKPLEEVILKCLEKKPDDRYASAADLLVALSGLRA
jgi:serine/threonine-protein kinase